MKEFRNFKQVLFVSELILMCVFGLSADAKYGGGTGEPNDPYLIYTAKQMNQIGMSFNWNDWDKCFKLMADIDLDQYTGEEFNIIGESTYKPFSGVFDGNGHTIFNFTYISMEKYDVGLFGVLRHEGAEIRDLCLMNVNIDAGEGNKIGAIVGTIRNNGKLSNCHVEGGIVSGNRYVGGLVGYIYYGGAIIENCFCTANVEGVVGIGGIIGVQTMSTLSISNSYATGKIFGLGELGGLIGYAEGGTVSHCYATGNVNGGGGAYIGGLIGSTGGFLTVEDCYTLGNIKGYYRVGGLIGKSGSKVYRCFSTGKIMGAEGAGGLIGSSYGGDVWNCFSLGDVSGEYSCGGLIGFNYHCEVYDCYSHVTVRGIERTGGLVGFHRNSSISNSYSVGRVLGDIDIGGLVGMNYRADVDNCFWDIESSGQLVSAGGTGLPTAQMQTGTTFIGAGWDFVIPIWMIDDGFDYPRLWWVPPYEETNLVALEINGPEVVDENSTAQYKAIAFYDNGTSEEVTDWAYWSVDPNVFADIDDSALLQTTYLIETEDITLTVKYFEGETELKAQLDVSILDSIPEITLYVDDDAPNDPAPGDPNISDPCEDGSKHHPFDSIQEAIDVTIYGDTIIIADGIYTGSGNRDIDFLGKRIIVKSQNGAQNCFIDCQGSASESHRGFIFQNGELPDSILDGVTVCNGYAPQMTGVSYGGGICCWDSSPTIKNCIIKGNYAGAFGGHGGGIYCRDSNAIIMNCIISENTVKASGSGSLAIGGGICCNGKPTIQNCIISNNRAERDGNGGGIYGAAVICDSVITSNFSNQTGGGLGWYWGSMEIKNCVISGNSSKKGGALYSVMGSGNISNCIISGNSASDFAGGIYCFGEFAIYNSTIVSNKVQERYAGMYHDEDSATTTNYVLSVRSAILGNVETGSSYDQLYPNNLMVANSIIWDGSDQIWPTEDLNLTITYSNIQGGWQGEGNIDVVPSFTVPGYWDVNDTWYDGDYHLLSESPCINAGDPNYIAEPNETDLDGNPRIVGISVDMGAYEFFNTPPVADAGPDQVVECACNTAEPTMVTLDSCGSYDADGDPLTYTWTGPFVGSPVHGATPTVTLEGGCPDDYVITLVVNDGTEDSEPDQVTITVVDTTPPEFEFSVAPTMLWPPDHKMVLIIPSWAVSDDCVPTPDVMLVSIEMSEADDIPGGGNTSDDIQIGDDGSIYLRAERSGTSSDRTYTITYQAVDDSGNTTVRSATVSIPHDFKVLARIASRWLWASPAGRIPEDLNGDGIVNLADFARFAENWIK